jgi:hypothetical protein
VAREWRSQPVAETSTAVRVLCALVGCGRGVAVDPFAVSTIRPDASGLFPLPVGKPAVCHRVPELMWVNVPDAGSGSAAVEKLPKPCPSEESTGIDPQRRHVVVWGPAGTLAQNRCSREDDGAGLGMSPSVCAAHSGRAR